jgi:hypothetical protein
MERELKCRLIRRTLAAARKSKSEWLMKEPNMNASELDNWSTNVPVWTPYRSR